MLQCNREKEYVNLSYSRSFCSRSHRRYTMCHFHLEDTHPGKDWRDCNLCKIQINNDTWKLWAAMNAYSPRPPRPHHKGLLLTNQCMDCKVYHLYTFYIVLYAVHSCFCTMVFASAAFYACSLGWLLSPARACACWFHSSNRLILCMQRRIHIGLESIFWGAEGGRCQECSGHEPTTFPMQFHESLSDGATSHRSTITKPEVEESEIDQEVDYSDCPGLEGNEP